MSIILRDQRAMLLLLPCTSRRATGALQCVGRGKELSRANAVEQLLFCPPFTAPPSFVVVGAVALSLFWRPTRRQSALRAVGYCIYHISSQGAHKNVIVLIADEIGQRMNGEEGRKNLFNSNLALAFLNERTQ